MKTIIQSFVILVFFTLIACDKTENQPTGYSGEIIGYWIDPLENDTILTFNRANSLKKGDYGFAFRPSQQFIERKNAGWCGTPPISYADYEGTWARTDSTLTISVGYWGGMAKYHWKIISVDNDKLSIYRMNEVYGQ